MSKVRVAIEFDLPECKLRDSVWKSTEILSFIAREFGNITPTLVISAQNIAVFAVDADHDSTATHMVNTDTFTFTGLHIDEIAVPSPEMRGYSRGR